MTPLQKRIKALATDLQKSVSRLEREASVKDVHRLRTTIRRLESMISYTHPELGRKQQKAMDELRSLRKRAGKVRDLDIQIGLLGGIANGSTAGERRLLSAMMKARRARQANRLSAEIRDLEHKKFFPRMEKVSEKAGLANPGPGKASPLEQAHAAVVDLAHKAPSRQGMRAARMHELRISLKRVRYTAELAEESDARQRMLDELKPVQDALGEWHDWETLVATAEKFFHDRVNCPLLAEMRSLHSMKFSEATAAVSGLFTKYASAETRKPSAVSPPKRLARPA